MGRDISDAEIALMAGAAHGDRVTGQVMAGSQRVTLIVKGAGSRYAAAVGFALKVLICCDF